MGRKARTPPSRHAAAEWAIVCLMVLFASTFISMFVTASSFVSVFALANLAFHMRQRGLHGFSLSLDIQILCATLLWAPHSRSLWIEIMIVAGIGVMFYASYLSTCKKHLVAHITLSTIALVYFVYTKFVLGEKPFSLMNYAPYVDLSFMHPQYWSSQPSCACDYFMALDFQRLFQPRTEHGHSYAEAIVFGHLAFMLGDLTFSPPPKVPTSRMVRTTPSNVNMRTAGKVRNSKGCKQKCSSATAWQEALPLAHTSESEGEWQLYQQRKKKNTKKSTCDTSKRDNSEFKSTLCRNLARYRTHASNCSFDTRLQNGDQKDAQDRGARQAPAKYERVETQPTDIGVELGAPACAKNQEMNTVAFLRFLQRVGCDEVRFLQRWELPLDEGIEILVSASGEQKEMAYACFRGGNIEALKQFLCPEV